MAELGVTRREFMSWLSRSGLALAAAGGALPVLGAGSAGAEQVSVTVLRGATVVDATGAPPQPNTTVVLADDRIVAVAGPGLAVPAGARVLDLRGKYVLPGLWDTHTHLMQLHTIVPASHVVYGVTGVREMWGLPESYRLRQEFEAGTRLGPRMVIGSTIIDGPGSFLSGATVVEDEASARAVVVKQAAAGAEFVKVYTMLTPPLLAAIADEAEKHGLRVAGHLADRVSHDAALLLRQKSYEHMFGMVFGVSREEAEYRRKVDALVLEPGKGFEWFKQVRELERQAGASYSPARAVALARRLRQSDGWLSPTLRTNLVLSSPADTFAGDERMRYLPPSFVAQYAEGVRRVAPVTPEQIARQAAYTRLRHRIVLALHHAGAGVVGGTDCGNPYCFPGSGLHDEIELSVRAGFTPLAALQTVTRDAARFLGLAEESGTVTPGKKADLLVVEANPLADIRNTRRIHTVVARGKVFGPAERDRLLAEIEKAALETVAVARPVGCCG